jgi:hypothetical protein
MSDESRLLFKLNPDETPEEWRESAERMRAELAAALTAAVSLSTGRVWRATDFAAAAEAMRALFDVAEQAFTAAEALADPNGYLAQAVRQAEQMRRDFAEYLASLPEEEREELRQAARDAPVCPVDMNASDFEM